MRKLILACALAAISAIAGAQTTVIGAVQPNFVYKQAPTTSPSTVAVTVYTTPGGTNQIYRVCSQLVITVAGTGGGAFPALSYTSQGHNYTNVAYSQVGAGLAGNNVAVNAQWNWGTGCVTFQADPGTAIQNWVGLGGVTGSPTYLWSSTLERLN